MARVTISAQKIKSRMEVILKKTGIPEKDAEIIADSLIEAEVQGRESHGLMRFPALYSRIVNGNVTKVPNIHFESIGTNLYAVDGDNALGAVLATRTMEFCERVAKEHGIAVATVRSANHLGAAGYYTMKAAREGFFAFVASTAGPAVAPAGGMSQLLGTNPFSVSFPAGKYDNFTLDIATSASAFGKIMMYAKEAKEIPIGWAMDRDGNDTTDANMAIDAYKNGVGILPMAGHKGMGISMIIDVLAGLLSGARFSYEVSDMFHTNGISGVGYFYVVMDIERFMPMNQFTTHIENWFDMLKTDRRRPNSTEIFMPGELENINGGTAAGMLNVFEETIEEIEKIELSLD